MFSSLLYSILAASTALAAPAPVSALSKRGETFSGRTTFYTVADSNPHTACDTWYTDESSYIVALSMSQWKMELCGKTITVQYQGKTVTATIFDGCETCSFGQIDLSPGAMSVLDSNYLETGQFTADWWINGDGGGKQPDPAPEPLPTPEKPTTTEAPPPSPTPEPKPETSSTSTTPSPTPTAEPSPSTTTTSTSSSVLTPASSSISPSASLSMSALSSSLSANATSSSSLSVSSNSTTVAASATISLNTSSTAIAPDSVVSTGSTSESESGNLAMIQNLVSQLGRIVVVAAA